MSWITNSLRFLENYCRPCLTFLNISISDSRDWAVNVWKYWLMLFVFLNYRFQILRCAHYMILFSRMFIQLLFGMCNSWNNKNIFQILFTHSLIILPLYTSKRFLIRYRKNLLFYGNFVEAILHLWKIFSPTLDVICNNLQKFSMINCSDVESPSTNA